MVARFSSVSVTGFIQSPYRLGARRAPRDRPAAALRRLAAISSPVRVKMTSAEWAEMFGTHGGR
jgi:hypothetical protein